MQKLLAKVTHSHYSHCLLFAFLHLHIFLFFHYSFPVFTHSIFSFFPLSPLFPSISSSRAVHPLISLPIFQSPLWLPLYFLSALSFFLIFFNVLYLSYLFLSLSFVPFPNSVDFSFPFSCFLFHLSFFFSQFLSIPLAPSFLLPSRA